MARIIGKFVKFAMYFILAGFVLIEGFMWLVFTFFNPHEKAMRVTCASNEKQLGLAISQYEQ